MPEGAQSSKTGFSSGFKGKIKKFGQTLGVGESRSRSQSPSASVSSVPSIEKTEPLPAARARASTPPIGINTLRTRSQPDATTRDLWQAAFETLTPEDKRALATSNGDADHAKPPASLVEDVVRLTTEKCAQYEAGGWHIERKGHEDINVRDKAKSLLLSVLTFKDLIDAGLKFDVSGYGALAWSVVSFGLNLVQNDKDRTDAIFKASAFLAEVLARYANVEANYRDVQIPDTEHFENAIVSVYVAVLQYSAKVKLSERAGRTRRVFESVASLTGQPLQSLEEAINSTDNATEKWRMLIEHQYRLKESHEINQKANDILSEVTRTVNELKILKKSVLTAEEDGILDWLSSLEYFSKHNRLRKKVQRANPQSGQWFLESEKFSIWDFLPQSFLWLYGPSGCGKSCLCSTIVDTIEREKRRNLAYWYFDFDNSETQDVDNMLCSLIRQLSAGTDSFPDAIRRLSDDHRKKGSRPNTKELSSTLHSIISTHGKDVSLVLDGLDEYPEGFSYAQGRELSLVIRDIVEWGHDNLHFLVTSKNEEDIRYDLRRLSNRPRELDVEKLLLFDLEMFFDNVMQNSQALQRLGDSTKDDIRTRLMAGEQRRFHWTALNLDELQLCRGNDSQVRQALHRIPDTVEAKYLQVLDNLDRHDLESAESIFTWLCVSKRPLTNIELAKAAGLSDPSDVRRICTSNLITSSAEIVNFDGRQEKCEVMRFAHSSVKEFLMSESLRSAPGNASRFYVSTVEAHAKVALYCLRLLNRQHEALQPRQTLLKIPLLQYSAQYWHNHAKSMGSFPNVDSEREIELETYELFKPSFSQSFSTWLRLVDPEEPNQLDSPDQSPETYPEPLYYALLLGLQKVSRMLIEDNVDVNGRCGIEGTALQLAAHRGYTSIVELLLENGSFVNVEGNTHGSALYASTVQGHGDVVTALLRAGANVNRQEGEYGNVLQVASYFPYPEIFHEILHQEGTDVNVKGGLYGSPLGAACAAGHLKYVMQLLYIGADPNAQGGILGSPLQAALMGNNDEIVHHLLEKGARYKPCGSIFWKEAYLGLRKENEQLITQFENKLTANSNIPQELTLDQQLLAAVIVKSPKEVAAQHRFLIASKLAEPHGRIVFWESMERLVALVTDLETVSEDPEQAGFVYNRLFWAGLFLAIPSTFKPGVEDNVILLQHTVRIAARITNYENVAFDTDPARRVPLYRRSIESIVAFAGKAPIHDRIKGKGTYRNGDFEREEAVDDRLIPTISQLCSTVFLALAKSTEQTNANRIDLVLRALGRNRKNDVRTLETIKTLDESCRDEVDAIFHADLRRAKGRITDLEDRIARTEADMQDEIVRMKSKMRKRVGKEVGKRLKDDLLFLMPELRGRLEQLGTSNLPQMSTPSPLASPTSSSESSEADESTENPRIFSLTRRAVGQPDPTVQPRTSSDGGADEISTNNPYTQVVRAMSSAESLPIQRSHSPLETKLATIRLISQYT